MAVLKALVLITAALGIATGLGGLVVSRLHWRKDVPLRMFWRAGSDLGAHPEKYVQESAVPVVRRLNMTGVALFLFALLAAVIAAVVATIQ